MRPCYRITTTDGHVQQPTRMVRVRRLVRDLISRGLACTVEHRPRRGKLRLLYCSVRGIRRINGVPLPAASGVASSFANWGSPKPTGPVLILPREGSDAEEDALQRLVNSEGDGSLTIILA